MVLQDFHMFNLLNNSWTQILCIGLNSYFKSCNSSSFCDSHLFIFGGNHENGYANSDLFVFELEDFKVKQMILYSKKTGSISNSVFTLKDLNNQENPINKAI